MTLTFQQIFGKPNKIIIGMVHVGALPGSPLWKGQLKPLIETAFFDAKTLVGGGVDGVMLENFFDIPFFPGRVPAETVAALTRVATEVSGILKNVPLGINVLRNDGRSALAIAAAVGARFVRVNVLCGARVADQGLIQGEAADLMRLRKNLGIEKTTAVWADVDVKHSAALAERFLEDEVEDTVERGLADAVIVSGAGTGKATDLEKVKRVSNVAGVPVLIGSGVTVATVGDFLAVADGVIVGTSLKKGPVASPVDAAKVRALVKAARR